MCDYYYPKESDDCRECPLIKHDSEGGAECIWNKYYFGDERNGFNIIKPEKCKVISVKVKTEYDVKEEEGYINGCWFGKEKK